MQQTFAAPTTGIGPNRYINSDRIFVMLGVAFVVHMLFLIVADLLPDEEIKQVPVRALNLKLGDANSGIGMQMVPRFTPPTPIAPTPIAEPTPPAAIAPAPKAAKPAPAKKSYAPPKVKKITVKEAERKKPAEQPTKQIVKQDSGLVTETIPMPAPVATFELPKPTAPAIAAKPQEYVREQAVTPVQQGVGNEATGIADETSKAEILKRYEQLLSSWIQRHKVYPDEAKQQGLQGEPIVRIRIDRQGNVRYSSLEKLTNHRLLNIAAMEMIKRANPVPAVPANYPGGQILEFLIPVSYKLR